MEPWQERVVEEKIELGKKASALSVFIGLNKDFDNIDREEQERLREQCEVMWEYYEILESRINAFK